METLSSTMQSGAGAPLVIHMFGVLYVARGEHVFTDSFKRSKQLEGLLKYLIAYRGRYVTPEEIVDALWENKACENPAKAVQNLVYRLRNMIDVPGMPSHVLFANGGYGWNKQAHYELDLEEFDRRLERAEESLRSGQPNVDLFFQALELYTMDFLSNSIYELWTVALRQKWKLKYSTCVETLLGILQAQGRQQEIIELCERATTIDPYNEKVHAAYLQALVDANRIAHARMHYTYITELLYRDLGVSPSAELREIYARINGNTKYVQHDMDTIINSFREEEKTIDGPYFCNVEVFHEQFRLEARRLKRSGQSDCLLLLTFSNANYGVPPQETLRAARKTLNDVLLASLRKGDVVCMWNEAQVLVMLVSLTFEDAEMIARRIITRFHKAYQGAPLMLQKKISLIQAEVG